MSNVLIGIIGVILFIGLALAGALILGDDFRSARSDSKAAQAVHVLQQVSAAANMYRLKTGRPVTMSSFQELYTRKFLKEPQTYGGRLVSAINETGCAGCATGNMIAAGLFLGTDPDAKSVCESIARQTGQIGPDQTYEPASLPMIRANQKTEAGCTKAGSEYYAFAFV